VHDYAGIDLEIVWNVIETFLSEMLDVIIKIKDETLK
jgi:uncharacterized protein with HEPN domain